MAVDQLIKEIPRLLWTLKVRYPVRKTQTLDTVFSQLNPVYTLTLYL